MDPFLFFFNDPAPTEIYTPSLHDALPIWGTERYAALNRRARHDYLIEDTLEAGLVRSEEHTSELQSRRDLVCRLLLEKKNNTKRLSCDEQVILESSSPTNVSRSSLQQWRR